MIACVCVCAYVRVCVCACLRVCVLCVLCVRACLCNYHMRARADAWQAFSWGDSQPTLADGTQAHTVGPIRVPL